MRLKLFNRPRYSGQPDLISVVTGLIAVLGVVFQIPISF